mmetsp:Transcript_42283/g.128277  ORF Transcript_42283/g.128277 Transcript_42283/m.128277 type:complete len:202 (+) Transcript_42283:596-1201(+)
MLHRLIAVPFLRTILVSNSRRCYSPVFRFLPLLFQCVPLQILRPALLPHPLLFLGSLLLVRPPLRSLLDASMVASHPNLGRLLYRVNSVRIGLGRQRHRLNVGGVRHPVGLGCPLLGSHLLGLPGLLPPPLRLGPIGQPPLPRHILQVIPQYHPRVPHGLVRGVVPPPNILGVTTVMIEDVIPPYRFGEGRQFGDVVPPPR